MRRLWALLGLMLAAASPIAAHAEGALGGSVASARLNGSDFADLNGSTVGWKAFIGGYSQILGGELQYIDFGHPGNVGSRLHAYAADLTGGWHFPIGIYPYAKIGAAFLDVKHESVGQELQNQGDEAADNPNYRRTKVFWGVGTRFPIAEHFGLRAEYERFYLLGQHEDLLSGGAEFRF